MKLNNGLIENMAVNAINSAAVQPGSYLSPNIPVGDKGVSFDGSISVYTDGSQKKESLVGNVPVQVKGTEVKDFHDTLRMYSLDMAHYKNYLNSDGVLLLVVEIKATGEAKIFYKSLLGMELSLLIKNYGHQQTKSVELRAIEETNLYTVCRKFLSEQKFQPKVLVDKMTFSFDAFKDYTLSSLTFDPAHPKTSFIFEHDFTVYGILNDTRFPLQLTRIAAMSGLGLRRFMINGVSYDLMTKVTLEERKITLVLEEVFSMTYDESQMRLNFRFIGFHSLANQLKVIPFIIELFAGHTVELLDSTFALKQDAEKLQKEFQQMHNLQRDLHDIARVFHNLGIPEDTIFNESDDVDIYLGLHVLKQSIDHNKLKGITIEGPDNARLINLKLADKSVLVFYNPKGDSLFTNGFSEEMLKVECTVSQSSETDGCRHSIFITLSEEALSRSVNFNSDIIKNSFDLIDPFYNDVAYYWTNQFCLKCVKSYDLSGNPQLLDVAGYVYGKYLDAKDASNPMDPVILINLLQIQKRLCDKIPESDIEKLIQLKREAIIENNQDMLFCIDVLLNNKIEASVIFKKWDYEKRKVYEGLPIYKLYLDL